MEKSDKQEKRKNKFSDIKIFPVPFALEEIKENDRRASIKKEIKQKYNSELIEEKLYNNYLN
tara:strand:- start:489 stop:674 length:186 start_codon:yes stop_codon:yes gene_type:complete